MRRWALLFAVAVMVAAEPAAAAVSHPRRNVLARGILGAAAVDGVHLVAWGGGSGRIALYDDRTGVTQRIPLTHTCNRVIPIDATDGFFLVICGTDTAEGATSRQIVFDATTGQETDLPLSTYERIGRQWVEGTDDSSGEQVVIYTNWHTGETRTEGEAPSGQVRTPFDLDSPNLDAVALAGKEFVVGSSLALEQVRSGRRYSIHLMGRMDDRSLYRCTHACLPVSLKGGLAMWQDGSQRLFGYALRSGRRREWRVSDSAVVRGSTSRRVYFLTPSTSSPQFTDLRSFSWR
jgi:hypothetical protein